MRIGEVDRVLACAVWVACALCCVSQCPRRPFHNPLQCLVSSLIALDVCFELDVQEYDGLVEGRVAVGSQGGSADVVDHSPRPARAAALPTD